MCEYLRVEQPDWKMEQNTISKICKGTGPWGEDWDAKLQRIKDNSPFKDFESYRCRPIIVKGGDDLRQELLAMQVI
jgi:phosphatidylinositol 4-kinase